MSSQSSDDNNIADLSQGSSLALGPIISKEASQDKEAHGLRT